MKTIDQFQVSFACDYSNINNNIPIGRIEFYEEQHVTQFSS
jgi:hypothetical protein